MPHSAAVTWSLKSLSAALLPHTFLTKCCCCCCCCWFCSQDILARVRDASLRHCLQFGVGLHHAGLAEADRQVVERLFVSQKIQVCACALGAKSARQLPSAFCYCLSAIVKRNKHLRSSQFGWLVGMSGTQRVP
jgi:hypothetical protein